MRFFDVGGTLPSIAFVVISQEEWQLAFESEEMQLPICLSLGTAEHKYGHHFHVLSPKPEVHNTFTFSDQKCGGEILKSL